MVADQYPYDRASTNLGIRLPTLGAGRGKIKDRLADPATRRKIAGEMKQNVAEMGEPDYGFATVARFTPNAAYEGKTIPEISAAKGRAPGVDSEIETIFDLMDAGGAGMIYRLMGELDIERIMRYPFTAVASDGGVTEFGVGNPHPRSLRHQRACDRGVRAVARRADAGGRHPADDLPAGPHLRPARSRDCCARAWRRTW